MAAPSLRNEEIHSAPASAWLDSAAQEEHALIVHRNDAEREHLSRLHGFTWVPLGLSAVVMATLLALGALLALSLDAHSRAAPELRAKFLVVRAVLDRAQGGARISILSVPKVGDWGREGKLNQSEVARAMAASGSEPDFVISTGDNFYESGLTSVADSQLDTSFSSVYSSASLQVPWHAVLGNHDYGELWTNASSMPLPPQCRGNRTGCSYGPLHQLDVRLAARDARWHCERWYSLSLLGGAADVFFIDTSPGVAEYQAAPWAGNPGGIASQSWEAQLLELEARLAASRARVKLVVGHHPVRSKREGEYPEIGRALQPLFERYGVAAYFCGHEHNLQYLHAEGDTTHYVVSGGGSKADYHVQAAERGDQRMFHQGSGFVACELTPRSLGCQFHGIAGAGVFHTVSISL